MPIPMPSPSFRGRESSAEELSGAAVKVARTMSTWYMVPVGTEIQDEGVWQHEEASAPQQNFAESPLTLFGQAIKGMAALEFRRLPVMKVSIPV